MDSSLDEVEVAVNVQILRKVLKKLRANSKKWCVAFEPVYAFEKGYVTAPFGCRSCIDRLNMVLYRARPLIATPQLLARTNFS